MNIPIPTKVGSKTGGEFTYPNMVPIGFDPQPYAMGVHASWATACDCDRVVNCEGFGAAMPGTKGTVRRKLQVASLGHGDLTEFFGESLRLLVLLRTGGIKRD